MEVEQHLVLKNTVVIGKAAKEAKERQLVWTKKQVWCHTGRQANRETAGKNDNVHHLAKEWTLAGLLCMDDDLHDL